MPATLDLDNRVVAVAARAAVFAARRGLPLSSCPYRGADAGSAALRRVWLAAYLRERPPTAGDRSVAAAAGHPNACERATLGSVCYCDCAGVRHAVAHTGGIPASGQVTRRPSGETQPGLGPGEQEGQRTDGGNVTTRRRPAIGRNLLDGDDIEWDGLADREIRTNVLGQADEIQMELATLNGFHGPPALGDRAAVDAVVADGGTELFRGIGTAAHAEQFLTGEYRTAPGSYGAGIYTTTDDTVSSDYAGKGNSGVALRMALHPDARVISYKDLDRRLNSEGDRLPELVRVDEGRYATALGYDAYYRKVGNATLWVVLNRTALMVERPAPSRVAAGRLQFNPRQPRDNDGQWTDTGRGLPDGRPGMHPAGDGERAAFQARVGRAIPPGWTDVHIADDLDGATQLVRGRDSKGRIVSMYSAAHAEGQAEQKFTRVREMTKHLDKLDHALERDADTNDHAAALLLIRRLGMRPGSERNTGAAENAHGATNLRARHVTVDGDTATFEFVGKEGVRIRLETSDPAIVSAMTRRLATRSGDDRLFDTSEARTRAYMWSTGVPRGFYLKDLRTLRANVIALREVQARSGVPRTQAEFRRWRLDVARVVAGHLGNTPTLALSSYINPTVFGPWLGSGDWL